MRVPARAACEVAGNAPLVCHARKRSPRFIEQNYVLIIRFVRSLHKMQTSNAQIDKIHVRHCDGFLLLVFFSRKIHFPFRIRKIIELNFVTFIILFLIHIIVIKIKKIISYIEVRKKLSRRKPAPILIC